MCGSLVCSVEFGIRICVFFVFVVVWTLCYGLWWDDVA